MPATILLADDNDDTGDARFERMGRALHSGADAFLTKPAEPRDVLRFVEELLRERGTGPAPAPNG